MGLTVQLPSGCATATATLRTRMPTSGCTAVAESGHRVIAVAESVGDFSESVDPMAFYKNVLRRALVAVGLPASQPQRMR